MRTRYGILAVLASFATSSQLGCGDSGVDDVIDAAPPATDAATSDPDASEPQPVGCFTATDRPGVCPPRGMFDQAVTVELFPTADSVDMYYTLDGTVPSATNGQRYTAPFDITPSQGVHTLQAVSISGAGESSRAATHSYIFPGLVLDQPQIPDGLPGTWGTGIEIVNGDYEMDPDVLTDDAVRAQASDALRELPVVSITMAHDDLYGVDRGIYMNPSQEGIEWEREAHVEYIPPDSAGIYANCGIRIQGGSSTRDWKSPKLSMRLFFRGVYGPGKLRYQIFEDSIVDEFNTLILDAHLNYTWIHPQPLEQSRAQIIRDQYVADLQNEVGSLAPHGRFVHLYLNGMYWGMYNLHERPDDDFAASYLGGAREEYDVFKHRSETLVDGTRDAWDTMFTIARSGLADLQNYQDLQQYLDIDDLINYILVNFYVGNTDWAHHNWYAARRRVPGAGFRFFIWDAEIVMIIVYENRTMANDMGGPTELYQLLMANSDFRARFIARANELLGQGGAFYVDNNAAYDPKMPERNRPAALYMRRVEEVRNAILLESARWGDYRRPTMPYTPADWEAELDLLHRDWFPLRSGIFDREQISQL